MTAFAGHDDPLVDAGAVAGWARTPPARSARNCWTVATSSYGTPWRGSSPGRGGPAPAPGPAASA
ncbi:hypothetical protein NKH77_01110 [Streptomyces sp. M19]